MSFSANTQGTQAPGAFQNARHFVINNSQFVSTTTDDSFMKELAGYTIQGAELDSSARDPPPRCHPGTRKGIVDRMGHWFCDPCRTKMILWLVGPAGAGKSAIMQTVAEVECQTSILAALFFSAPNGRNDPSKVIATLAYQIAAQHPPYLHYIRSKITADPKVLEKSIRGQFLEFIIRPFVTGQLHQTARPILIFIDGLDECHGHNEQILFLGLISYFTTKYPNAPLLWVISSRPEDHITDFLTRERLTSCFDKEEVSVDSTEACQDIERFLRAKFTEMQSSNSVRSLRRPSWPPENLLLKLFAAALGHFAYADTVIRFIRGGNHVSRFQLVIDLIERPASHKSGAETTQPMARLDTLYLYIIEQIAPDDLPHTKEILSHLLFPPLKRYVYQAKVSFMCDWLGKTPDVMYSALRELHSVLEIPSPDKPFKEIGFHHKSFADSLLRMQTPGLPVDRCDAGKMHKSQVIHILNRIPICYYPTAPEIPQSLYSWTYKDSKEFKRAEKYLSRCLSLSILESGAFLDQPVSTDTIHALKVAAAFSGLDDCNCFYFLREIFDDSSTLARHLRGDGSLRDIPIELLEIDVGREDGFLFFFSDGDINNSFAEERYVLCIKNAILSSPDILVKAFIANRLQGWIDVTTFLLTSEGWDDFGTDWLGGKRDLSMVLLEYDFSAIYATIMCGGPDG